MIDLLFVLFELVVSVSIEFVVILLLVLGTVAEYYLDLFEKIKNAVYKQFRDHR